jgi:UrcA family protein
MRSVQYANLNLSAAAGVKTLHQRMKAAITKCRPTAIVSSQRQPPDGAGQ